MTVCAITLTATTALAGPPSPPAAAAVCRACHGAGGEGNPPAAIPHIAGQSPEYLEKQLRDYASGDRVHPVMRNFAKPLSDADRSTIATYFASLRKPSAMRAWASKSHRRQAI
jgi:cytochrome c553